jgi:HK97 family phage major capsid protein
MNELQKRIADIDARERVLLGDENKILSDEERTEYDALEAERSECEVKLARAKEDDAKRKALATRASATTGRPAPVNPGTGRVDVKGNAADADPKRGFKTPRDFLTSVMNSGLTGRIDERLRPLRQAAAGSDEQGEYSDSYGGYLIPEGFMPNLMSVQAEGDPTVGRTTQVPMTNPVVRVNARTDKNHSTSVSGGLRVYRRSETEDVPSSRMAIEQVTLNVHSLMGVAYASEEILTDSPVSFAALLEAGMRDEFGSKIVREKIRGPGVGEYEGVLNTPALITVTKETGQSADTILYANIVKARSRCWQYANAIWLYNHDTLPQLMNLADDFGRFIWQTSARDGEPDMLLGRPAYPTEYCSTVGDAGDVILGNWSQYLEGQLQGVQSDESMHVRFLNNERTFRFTARNDGRVWWRTALTPAVSTTTLSPFVVLGAR